MELNLKKDARWGNLVSGGGRKEWERILEKRERERESMRERERERER
jgi:hypothetical protein